MRDLDTLLTSEMSQEEWSEFRHQWIKDYIQECVVECGMEKEDVETIADIRFEDYVGQEGWTMRDEQICMSREAHD